MTQAEFTERARNCERRLYRVARTLLSSETDCEDAVQEALLKAWARLHTLREEAYFETWLTRILINQCRSLHRKRAPAAAELPESLSVPEPGRSPLMEALEALPVKNRIAVELHYIEGYSVKECAKLLTVPEGTVKWRLHQGRRLLQRLLGEEAEP